MIWNASMNDTEVRLNNPYNDIDEYLNKQEEEEEIIAQQLRE